MSLFALLPLLLPAGQAQVPVTLADFLGKSKVVNRFVVDAEHVTANTANPDLEAFGRKETKIGGITAIVPRQMVLVDDSLTQAPNLYDGLPRAAKVLYLLSILNKEQLRLATSSGIGLGDLKGDQTAVFRSLLPESISWGAFQIDTNGIPRPQGSETQVSGAQLSQVKLRFSRQLVLMPTFNLPGGRTSYSFMDLGKEQIPGLTVRMRNAEAPSDDENQLFGVVVRRRVANVAKKSDVDYGQSRLSTFIAIPRHATVREILAAISTTTRFTFAPDLRVASLSVSFEGDKARAGDLLQAIALAVTGTYRKVGDTYLLTSDLAGQGARQLRLALWASNLETETERRSREWRLRVSSSGALKAVDFDPSDPTGPNDAMRARLQQEEGSTQHNPLPLADLNAAVQGRIADFAKFSTSPLKYEQAGLLYRVVYSFVMPDGLPLEPEHDDLGMSDKFFTPTVPPRPAGNTLRPVTKPIRFNNDRTPKSVVWRPLDIASAQAAVQASKSHGFAQIWIDTTETAILSAALAAGKEANLPVGLVIRPWQAQGTEALAERDLTLLGSAKDSPLLGPHASQTATRLPRLSALATTPGVAGLMILDTQPSGYETGDRLRGHPIGNVAAASNAEFGYSPALRFEFFRANGVDPIDLGRDGLRTAANLRVPFFDDPTLRRENTQSDGSLVDGLFEKWQGFRGDTNRKVIESFFAAFQSQSPAILVQPRARFETAPSRSSMADTQWAVPWTTGQAIPVNEESSFSSSGPAGAIGVWRMDPSTLQDEEGLGRQLSFRLKNAGSGQALDLSKLPFADAVRLLDEWLPKL